MLRRRTTSTRCTAGLTVALSTALCVFDARADRQAMACNAFTDSTTYVTSYVVRTHEGGKVRLRVPIEYFEDAWDRVDGFEDRSQLFSVDMDDFTPVTRPDTAVRNRERRFDYMWFTVGDLYDLNQIALNHASFGKDRVLTSLPHERTGPAGLVWLDTDHSSSSTFPVSDVFIARGVSGAIEAVIDCSSPNDTRNVFNMCSHFFRASGLDIKLSYGRIFLNEWRKSQKDVTDFLKCSTE